MRFNAMIGGVGMTRFGKHMETGLKAIGAEAVQAAIADAGIQAGDLEAAFVGNAAAGLVTGQECIRGQVILREHRHRPDSRGERGERVRQCLDGPAPGLRDGVGRLLRHRARPRGREALPPGQAQELRRFQRRGRRRDSADAARRTKQGAASQGAETAGSGAGEKRSMFMDIYAAAARSHMQKYGTTARQFAAVAAKNSYHGSMNVRAQFQELMTVDEVLAAPMIAEPLTRPMCSPIGDGAAAVIVMSERAARERGVRAPVRVVTMVLHSGWDHGMDEPGTVEVCAQEAFEDAGLGPKDVHVMECHDASAPAELIAYEAIGLCAKGEGGALIDSGATRLGGRIPVNTSGGLLRKGHPVGATGIAQIVELTEQLQGRSGKRQVPNARIGLAHNGGGAIGTDAAAMCVSILQRD